MSNDAVILLIILLVAVVVFAYAMWKATFWR